ncbi:MAG: nucleotidyltransferase domain-containing protein [Lachnospiraceae bacterium]|nr:nucleotidyltransferase domain-containing protein [Lachnospiraceae bacterium]
MKNNELKDFINSISQKYDLKKVILFGSRARGIYKYDSDIDLLVEYNTPTVSILKTVGLMQEIENKFNLSVDIVRYPIKNRGIELRIDAEVPIYG